MKKIIINKWVLFSVGFFCLLGCAANKKPKPEIASSANSPNYAVGYPAELSDSLTRYTEQTAKAKENTAAFAGYPEKLDTSDPNTVATVYTQADATGRGRAFADQIEEDRAVRVFFDREKDELARRINGSVIAAKEKAECECELDVYGSVSYALKESVDKQLEKRLQETGEYARFISEHEKDLGKKNAETLLAQADTIALTAHVVFVSLPTLNDEMSRMLSESKSVKKTLDSELEAEKARANDPATSKADKKDSKKRIQDIENAKKAIDIFINEADQLVSKANTEIPAIRTEYEKSFKRLMDTIKSQKK